METTEVDPSRLPMGEARPGPEARGSDRDAHAADPRAGARGRHGWGLGLGALACAVGMCIVTVIGSVTAGTAFGAAALPLALVALLLSAGAIALGVVAAVRRSGRALGLVGGILGVLLNPALLALVLPGGAS